jgi:hypothetical protein
MANTETMRERLIADHARIARLAAELIAVLSEPIPPDPFKLSSARWAFASQLMQHLALKERHIYAKLETDERQQVRQAFERSKIDLLKRFDQYIQHMDTWSTSKATASWQAYRGSAIAVVNSFTDRLKKEEIDLFNIVDRFGIDISSPSPVTLNWTRKAFDVKSRVDDH